MSRGELYKSVRGFRIPNLNGNNPFKGIAPTYQETTERFIRKSWPTSIIDQNYLLESLNRGVINLVGSSNKNYKIKEVFYVYDRKEQKYKFGFILNQISFPNYTVLVSLIKIKDDWVVKTELYTESFTKKLRNKKTNRLEEVKCYNGMVYGIQFNGNAPIPYQITYLDGCLEQRCPTYTIYTKLATNERCDICEFPVFRKDKDGKIIKVTYTEDGFTKVVLTPEYHKDKITTDMFKIGDWSNINYLRTYYKYDKLDEEDRRVYQEKIKTLKDSIDIVHKVMTGVCEGYIKERNKQKENNIKTR